MIALKAAVSRLILNGRNLNIQTTTQGLVLEDTSWDQVDPGCWLKPVVRGVAFIMKVRAKASWSFLGEGTFGAILHMFCQ